jgi:hypothetical protein
MERKRKEKTVVTELFKGSACAQLYEHPLPAIQLQHGAHPAEEI